MYTDLVFYFLFLVSLPPHSPSPFYYFNTLTWNLLPTDCTTFVFCNNLNSLPTQTIWFPIHTNTGYINDLFFYCANNQPTHNNIPTIHCRISSFTSTLPPPFHHEQYHPPSWSYHRFSPFLWNCLAVDMFNLHCPASDLFLSLPPYAAFLCCLKSVTPQCLFILFGMLSLASPFLLPFCFSYFNFI